MTQELESSESTESVTRRALHSEQPDIHNPVWRQMVVEWCYQVIDHISADRELVYITMNILDRFLAVRYSSDTTTCSSSGRCYLTDKKDYETAVMTALLMTMKLQGLSSLCISDLVKMSSNSVTSKDIIEAGKEIIQSLTWNKQIPTAARFAHALVQLLPETLDERIKMSIFENAVFQIELSVQDEFCSHQPPSLIAWMAFENALSDTLLPPELKASICSQVSTIMGHNYCINVRRRLQTFQLQSHVSTTAPVLIPPDDDDEDEESLPSSSATDLVFNLKSRPLTESNVISLEDLTSIPSMPHVHREHSVDVKRYHNHEDIADISSLRRTKRIRFC
jgi:hypothetical protein